MRTTLRLKLCQYILLLAGFCLSHHSLAEPVPKDANDIKPILIGQTIPSVSLENQQGEKVNLLTLVNQQPSLLIFYRGGWCPYCNTHLQDLRKIEKTLVEMGFQIIAISPDQPKYLRASGEKQQLNYALLSDSKMEAARALGLAFEVDAKTIERYKSYDIDLERSSGQKHHWLPVPAAILVDAEGKVTFTFVSPDYKIRVDNEVILAAARAQLKLQDKKTKDKK